MQGPLPFGFEVVDPKRQGPLPFGTEADDSEHQGPRKIHRYALNAGARICANTSRPLIALEDLPGSAWPLAQDGAALDQAGLLFSLGLVGPHLSGCKRLTSCLGVEPCSGDEYGLTVCGSPR